MIGRAYVPRWYLVVALLSAVTWVLRLVLAPGPLWQVAVTGALFLLLLPLLVVRDDVLLVRNLGRPRRVARRDVVGTHLVSGPWWTDEGVRVALRLRDGSELPVNALSHTGLVRSRRVFPARLLTTMERLGLPLPDGFRP